MFGGLTFITRRQPCKGVLFQCLSSDGLSGGVYFRSQGSDFTLHHVEQYTVSVPVDGQLPFAIVDDSDGSGCVCVERITAISGACRNA